MDLVAWRSALKRMVNRQASVCAHMHACTYKARIIFMHTHIYRQIDSISFGISGFSMHRKSDPQFTLDDTREASRGASVETAEMKFSNGF